MSWEGSRGGDRDRARRGAWQKRVGGGKPAEKYRKTVAFFIAKLKGE